MTKEYYRKNRAKWLKGGDYYKYKPKVHEYELIITRGVFLVSFD